MTSRTIENVFRLFWMSFALDFAYISATEYIKNQQIKSALFSIAWLLWAILWFMQPFIPKANLQAIISSMEKSAIGPRVVRAGLALLAMIFAFAGLFFKYLPSFV